MPRASNKPKVDHALERTRRLVDPDGGSLLRSKDGALLTVPTNALPHKVRALTLRAHARESRFDARNGGDALWDHEKEMWLQDEDEDEDVTAPHTLEDFLPADVVQHASRPLSTWDRGMALLDESRAAGIPSDLTLTQVETAALVHKLTLDELASVCVAVAETAHEIWAAGAADAVVAVALQVLTVVAAPPSVDEVEPWAMSAVEPAGVAGSAGAPSAVELN